MMFSSFSEFLQMDGHGLYVWICYAVGAIVLLYNVIAPRIARKAFIRQQLQRIKREGLKS